MGDIGFDRARPHRLRRGVRLRARRPEALGAPDERDFAHPPARGRRPAAHTCSTPCCGRRSSDPSGHDHGLGNPADRRLPRRCSGSSRSRSARTWRTSTAVSAPSCTPCCGRSSASSTASCGVDERREMGVGLRRLADRLQLRRPPVHLRRPAAAGPPAAEPGARPGHEPLGRLQHRRQLRDQHELAGLRAGDVGELPHADGRAGVPELRLGRGGHGGRGGLHPRPDAHSAREIGNFWVDFTRSFLYVLLPIAIVGALFLVSQGVVQNLNGPTHAVTVEGVAADDRPGARSPRRRSSRSSAPTAAASSTPTRRTRSRTRRR